MTKNPSPSVFDKIVSLTKRRGFIYPGSEIYGGLAGFYDWGHLGRMLKRNIEDAWWWDTVQRRDDVVGIDAALIMNSRAWEASGHVSGFSDPLVECKKCHKRFRTDDLQPTTDGSTSSPSRAGSRDNQQPKASTCPECGGELTKSKQFNLMFQTHVGPAADTASLAYLRPETAGGIFVNFKNILAANRLKIPFGIAQIGKAFRNEINPRDFIFRTREFKQMELEYFVKPGEDEKYFAEWVERRLAWYDSIGLRNVRKREQTKEERAHYSKATVDIEYRFPMSAGGGSASGGGWKEIEGVANRGDFDLSAHAKTSGQDLTYLDDESKERYVPYVIEPSAGVERIALALLCDAYSEDEKRVVLKFHPRIAPVKVAVFPLLANKPDLVKLARSIYEKLKTDDRQLGPIAWDDRGNIGKRYYSQDEIGTPFCVTVDFDSLSDPPAGGDVTVRDRDTTKQDRVKINDLVAYLKEKLA